MRKELKQSWGLQQLIKIAVFFFCGRAIRMRVQVWIGVMMYDEMFLEKAEAC